MNGLRFFQPAVGPEIDTAFAFYQSFSTEFLWPRTVDEIGSMAEDGQLFAAADANRVLACCYMKPLEGGDINDVLRRVIDVDNAYEFGGVLVDDAARGQKIGSTLGRVSLAAVSAMASPSGVIAHVHEENELPRPLLERLGFGVTGEKDGPPFVPPGMKTNSEGKVVGDVYRFEFGRFADIADWLEAFGGSVCGRPAELSAILSRIAVATDLRALAGRE